MKIKGRQTLLYIKGHQLTFHQPHNRHQPLPTHPIPSEENNSLVTQVFSWQTNQGQCCVPRKALPSQPHCWLLCKSHLQPLLALSANFQKCWGPAKKKNVNQKCNTYSISFRHHVRYLFIRDLRQLASAWRKPVLHVHVYWDLQECECTSTTRETGSGTKHIRERIGGPAYLHPCVTSMRGTHGTATLLFPLIPKAVNWQQRFYKDGPGCPEMGGPGPHCPQDHRPYHPLEIIIPASLLHLPHLRWGGTFCN